MDVNSTGSIALRLRLGMLYTASAVIVLLCRLWLSFWAVVCLALFFLALAALGVFAQLGMGAHWMVIAAFAGAALWLARRAPVAFHWPTRNAIEHAMERAGGIAHRPLQALRDSIATTDALPLWHRHRQRMAETLRNIRLARLEGDVSAQDPYDLRHVAGLFFALALLMSGSNALPRMAAALMPAPPALPMAAHPALDIWLTPPAYTQSAPVYLARAHNTQATLTTRPQVPANSVLKIRLSGQRLAPVIRLDGKRVPVIRVDSRNYTAEATVTADSALVIRQGLRQLGRWPVAVTPDTAPKLSLVDAGQGGNGLLKLTWQAGDDYGLTALSATIIMPDEHAARLDGATVTTVSLPVPPRPEAGKKLDGVFTESIDLSRHPLAGTPVRITLSATDDAGHSVTSNDTDVTLPERTFDSAIARRLVAERKRLFWFAPNWLTRDFTTATLLDIVNTPQAYRHDRMVFLGLVSAVKRLGYDGRDEAITSTRDLLWDIALRVEDGGLSETSRNLQQALADLSSALNDPAASQQKLEELAAEVQQRMQEYMQALSAEMQQRRQEQQTGGMPQDIADQVMKRIDLDAVMQNLRGMAEGGQRQQLREMMEMLRKAVQNTDAAAMARMQQQQQQAMQALQELGNVIRAQQELIESTTQAGGDTPAQDWNDMADAQGNINSQLDTLRGKLGPLAGGMQGAIDSASGHMDEAGNSLSQHQRDSALAAQKEALQALMQAQDNAMQQLADQMQKMMMFGMGGARPQGGFGEGFDPLGREFGDGKAVGGSIGIPSEGERRRVQDIQRELRERYNDGNRSRGERDYLERLLDLFR